MSNPQHGIHVCALCLVFLGCDPRLCEDEANRARALPARLSETGLFQDWARQQLPPDVFAYSPEYPLWSDGAKKRRWISVPGGELIDTSDPEAWQFPVGTKLWKEFSVGDRALETRLLLKTSPSEDGWAAGAYIWLPDGSDAVLSPYGALDVSGTPHDVPAAGECFGCHAGRASRVLGFSAIQLAPRSYATPERLPAAAEQLLSTPLAELDVPGSAEQRAALGYLHANCSHCHNQSPSAQSKDKCVNPNQHLSFTLDFTLHTDQLADVEHTATYRTAIGKVIKAGNPGGSKVLQMMGKRGAFAQMPPLGTEQVDTEGLATIRAWIGEL